MKNEYDKKREILKDIILSEENVLTQLGRIVQFVKPFFKIEGNTGRVVLSTNFAFTNYEKLYLVILGKYLAYHSSILDQESVQIAVLADELGIKVTTLSGPLGRLIKNHAVNKPQKDTYQVNPHRIEVTMQILSNKYLADSKRKTRTARKKQRK